MDIILANISSIWVFLTLEKVILPLYNTDHTKPIQHGFKTKPSTNIARHNINNTIVV